MPLEGKLNLFDWFTKFELIKNRIEEIYGKETDKKGRNIKLG